MKRISVLLVFIISFLLIGCNGKQPESEMTYNATEIVYPLPPQKGGYFIRGWVPEVLEKQFPKHSDNTPDYINLARTLLDNNKMTFFIGMVDLNDPDGYRHIDDSGELHPSSVIKLWVAEYVYLQIHEGNGNLNDVLYGQTLEHHLTQMIQFSNNESAGYIISKYGRQNIDNWIKQNYKSTRLFSDFRGNYHQNKTNQTTVEDTVELLEKIYINRFTEPYSTIFTVMRGTKNIAKIPTAMSIYPEVRTANKTGSFIYYCAVDHDVGIIYGFDEAGRIQLAFAIVLFTFSKPDEPTFSSARPYMYDVLHDIYNRLIL
jgi:hypothetical protein